MTPDFGAAEDAVLGDDDMARLGEMCLCPTCPAYPEEDRGEKRAYCLRGSSEHKESIDPKDCLCENCEVYKHGEMYGRNFYCLEGAALKRGLTNLLRGRTITDLVDQKQRVAPVVFVSAGLDVQKRERA